MVMMTEGLLLTMMDPPQGGELEFNDWVNTEHIPERKRVAGFRTALRFESKDTSPRYLAIYDLDDIAVLKSDAYAAIAGKNLSPWSKRILAQVSGHWRFAGSRVDEVGDGSPTGAAAASMSELLLIAWRDKPGRAVGSIASTVNGALGDAPAGARHRLFEGRKEDGFDYVCIAESPQPFPHGFADRERFGSESTPCDFARIYVPLSATAQ
jgi:hypothetical protein